MRVNKKMIESLREKGEEVEPEIAFEKAYIKIKSSKVFPKVWDKLLNCNIKLIFLPYIIYIFTSSLLCMTEKSHLHTVCRLHV